MIGNANDETNFPHKLLLTNTQVAILGKSFANKSSTDIKLSKTHLSGGLLLIKNLLKQLAKSVLILLRLTAAASAADAVIATLGQVY